MPIYEYECRGCGNRFEKIVYGSAIQECPSCNSGDLERLLSTFAVASASSSRMSSSPAPCGSCGDPRGPGACSMPES
jgi:putative FmdB family regulatory protein